MVLAEAKPLEKLLTTVPIIPLVFVAIGNTLAIVVLFRKKLRGRRGTLYLIILSTTDILAFYTESMLSRWSEFALDLSSRYNKRSSTHIQYFLNRVFRAMTAYMIVALTLERLIAVWKPLFSARKCTNKFAHTVVITLFIFVCGLYCHELFGLAVFCPRRTHRSTEGNRSSAESNRSERVKRDIHTRTSNGTLSYHLRPGVFNESFILGSLKFESMNWLNRFDRITQWLRHRESHGHSSPNSSLTFPEVNDRPFSGRFWPTRENRTLSYINNHFVGKTSNKDSSKQNRSFLVSVSQSAERVTVFSIVVENSTAAHVDTRKYLVVKKVRTVGRKQTGPLRSTRALHNNSILQDAITKNDVNVDTQTGNLSDRRKENVRHLIPERIEPDKDINTCFYAKFHDNYFPYIDLVVGSIIPLIIVFLGDLAVIYKVFFRTEWIFVSSSSAYGRQRVISGEGQRKASKMTKMTAVLNCVYFLSTIPSLVVEHLTYDRNVHQNKDWQFDTIWAVTLILFYSRGALDFPIFYLVAPTFQMECNEMFREVCCQCSQQKGSRVRPQTLGTILTAPSAENGTTSGTNKVYSCDTLSQLSPSALASALALVFAEDSIVSEESSASSRRRDSTPSLWRSRSSVDNQIKAAAAVQKSIFWTGPVSSKTACTSGQRHESFSDVASSSSSQRTLRLLPTPNSNRVLRRQPKWGRGMLTPIEEMSYSTQVSVSRTSRSTSGSGTGTTIVTHVSPRQMPLITESKSAESVLYSLKDSEHNDNSKK